MKAKVFSGVFFALACFFLEGEGLLAADLISLLSGDAPSEGEHRQYVNMPQGVGRITSEKMTETKEETETTKAIAEKPVEVEKIVEKKVVIEKPVEVEKFVEVKVPVTNTIEKIVEKQVIVERPVEVEKVVIVERTNVVEKIVVDKTREKELLERERQLLNRQKELQDEKDELVKQVEAVQEKNQEMATSSAALGEQLAKERDRRQRLERVIPKESRQFADNFLRITAPSTYYDRKEGFAVFQGGVSVRDDQYELHSSRAFVFNDPVSNTVARIVALGNVAVTNGFQRAYGVKASYYRSTGMVILYGDEKMPAIVRDESRVDDQEVIGSKIKFWLNSQQVEVLKARIKTPLESSGALRNNLMGR